MGLQEGALKMALGSATKELKTGALIAAGAQIASGSGQQDPPPTIEFFFPI
jgi:hypothetical protein